jgi:predicted phage terminase large subunit-like protein
MNPIATIKARTREKLLADLATFSRRAWREVESAKALEWNWHHELLCEHLMLAYQREELRLIFCMPPRSLKSKLVSVFFPAWVWAKSPEQSFILTSYSDSLSEELNMARRTLLMSRWFQETFPGKVQFAVDQNRREQYKTLAGGQAIATSTEGTLTGKGADYLLVDDLLSPQQSYSDLERNNANRFFDSTLRSRLNDPGRGVIIVVCQRLHEADLPGHLNENEPGVWTTIVLPMESEEDEEIVFPLSGKVMHRKAGDLLHAARWPKSWVEKHKRTVGAFIWASQFEQRPAPAGGAIFKRTWFQQYEKLPEQGRVIIVMDTAYSIRKTADYSAASVWLASEGKYYLAWVWRARVEYPQLKRMVEELAAAWRPEAVVVEEKGSGQSLVQSLKQETELPVVGFKVEADKVSRAHGVTALFESGRVHLPKAAPWLADFLGELELFPAGAHDDQVDTVTMALAYLRDQGYEHRYGLLDLVQSLKQQIAAGILWPDGRPKQSAASQVPLATNRACCAVPLPVTLPGGGTRCANCGRQSNLRPLESTEDADVSHCPACGSGLIQIIPNAKRCGQCGHQFGLSVKVAPVMTRREWLQRPGRG